MTTIADGGTGMLCRDSQVNRKLVGVANVLKDSTGDQWQKAYDTSVNSLGGQSSLWEFDLPFPLFSFSCRFLLAKWRFGLVPTQTKIFAWSREDGLKLP